MTRKFKGYFAVLWFLYTPNSFFAAPSDVLVFWLSLQSFLPVFVFSPVGFSLIRKFYNASEPPTNL